MAHLLTFKQKDGTKRHTDPSANAGTVAPAGKLIQGHFPKQTIVPQITDEDVRRIIEFYETGPGSTR